MDKGTALASIYQTADNYRKELLDRDLLFVCLDKHQKPYMIDVTFRSANFLHLTGLVIVDRNITANDFFQRCLDRRLSRNDFEFDKEGWSALKLRTLPLITTKNMRAVMIGDYDGSHPKLITDKIVGGQNHCVGFVRDELSGRYVPNTVLECDIRQITRKPRLQIVLTCRKYRNEEKYAEVVYSTKKEVNWEKLKTKLLDLYGCQDIIALIDKTIAFRSGYLQHDKTQNEEHQNSNNMTTEEMKKQIAGYEAQKIAYAKKRIEGLPQSLQYGYALKAKEDFDKQHAEEAASIAEMKKIVAEREPKQPKVQKHRKRDDLER